MMSLSRISFCFFPHFSALCLCGIFLVSSRQWCFGYPLFRKLVMWFSTVLSKVVRLEFDLRKLWHSPVTSPRFEH